MNAKLEELEERLASYVPTQGDENVVVQNKKELQEFHLRFPADKLDELTPETYCIGRGDRDNFCWWIEIGTRHVSRYFPGSSRGYGMYWGKSEQAYRMISTIEGYRNSHSDADDTEVLRETIAKPLKQMVLNKGENGTFEAVKSVGQSLLLKLLILYYPDEFIHVNSTAWIDRIIDAYELEKPESYVERNKVLLRLYNEKKHLVKAGELTQQSFVGIVARHLKLVDPNFWHMQIHERGSGSLTRDEALKIIKEYGVVGMADAWQNDGSQPFHFKERVKIGDIIGVRENGFVALVRVTGPCRKNDSADELNWFDIVRPVELLSDDAEGYISRYKEKTGYGPHDNIYPSATLSAIKPNCKNKFLRFWYNSVMGLEDDEGAVSLPPSASKPEYDVDDFLADVFMTESHYRELESLLNKKKNLILMGAPGVGKTFIAKRLAWAMMGGKFADRVSFVQFHQSYSYEDFICGYRPVEGGGFTLVDGVFTAFCKKAAANPENDYFFIIDEINRGNVSKIFGELLIAIEADKRGDAGYAVRLAYKSDELFVVPENIYIIGMMNTADRSLAMMDYALRRRFSFYQVNPGFDDEKFKKLLAGKEKMKELVEAVKALNVSIAADPSLGEGFVIGHSYFCGESDPEEVVLYDLVPMLSEYWFDNLGKVKEEKEKLLNKIR